MGSAKSIDALVAKHAILEISSNQEFRVADDFSRGKSVPIPRSADILQWHMEFIKAAEIPKRVLDGAANFRYANADTGVDFRHPALVDRYLGNSGRMTGDKADNTTGDKLDRTGDKTGNTTGDKLGRTDETGIQFDHNYFWFDAVSGSKVPIDDNGHGTHTMSVAPLDGMSQYGRWGWHPELYLKCLQFFLSPTDLQGQNPRPDLRPHVIGNSYACPVKEGCSKITFHAAILALKRAGIFFVTSAGNDGQFGCGSISNPPAVDPLSFTVAASEYNSYARFKNSSIGPVAGRTVAIDLIAPGADITGAILNNDYAARSGTSAAAPQVAAAALIVMAACPHLERKVDRVATILRRSASPKYSTLNCGKDHSKRIPNNEFGFGFLNVNRAITMCQKQYSSFKTISEKTQHYKI
ncbi:hypothetical protein L0F63_006642 [Massospora cicadina]|nr:hypothetical protein L0F63_006642 [Massospora cicadina]